MYKAQRGPIEINAARDMYARLAAYFRNRPPSHYKGAKIEVVHAFWSQGRAERAVMVEAGRYKGYAVFGYEPYEFVFFDSYNEATAYCEKRDLARKSTDLELTHAEQL